MAIKLTDWTVDYGDGRKPKPVRIPHSWGQQLPLEEEGPVIYSVQTQVPADSATLRFHGVSYAASVYLNGTLVAEHKGLWDAFDINLSAYKGQDVSLEVHVVKNGGPTYPVKDVASGFLPYVFHTFGGIYKDVEWVTPAPAPTITESRVELDGKKIYVDGEPFYTRGLLHWGWYPDFGHTNPPEDVILQEVLAVKELGFNLIKFCLWVPSHEFLQILDDCGMFAWLELPLWDPTDDPDKQSAITAEFERIVDQYRHHSNILFWTIGCELSQSTPPEFRRYLTQMVRNRTGCPLVKDNSGGAEMYGGDLREFGTFEDFHPYCDTPFYAPVLDSLLPGARTELPILLGEFNDCDVHRDLLELHHKLPFWTSALSELNHQGVRWKHDLPSLLHSNRFAQEPEDNNHDWLIESSRHKALFIRKTVNEAVRARDAIQGYVITGLRDTPISTSGMFDDWGIPRFSSQELANWNSSDCLFVLPNRYPAWTSGGNRAGWMDPFNHFVGQIHLRIGFSSEHGRESGLVWKILDESGKVVARDACSEQFCPPLEAHEVGQISWHCTQPGSYHLVVQFGESTNEWPLWVVPQDKFTDLKVTDPLDLLSDLKAVQGLDVATAFQTGEQPAITLLQAEGTTAAPFWRESMYEFLDDDFWIHVPFAEQWSRLLPVSGDRVLNATWLQEKLGTELEVLLNRVDVRTYEEAPILVRANGKFYTTLRPFGGLGTQPTGITRNPAGNYLLRSLLNVVG